LLEIKHAGEEQKMNTITPWDDPVFEPIREALVQRMRELGWPEHLTWDRPDSMIKAGWKTAEALTEHADWMMRCWDRFTDNAVNDCGTYDFGDWMDREVVRLLWQALYLHYGVDNPEAKAGEACGDCGFAEAVSR
jgi:hypothetical protein